MVMVDREKVAITGDVVTVCSELALFIKNFNTFLDESENGAFLEEMLMSQEIVYTEFQKLAVRLENGHTRAKKNIDDWKKQK